MNIDRSKKVFSQNLKTRTMEVILEARGDDKVSNFTLFTSFDHELSSTLRFNGAIPCKVIPRVKISVQSGTPFFSISNIVYLRCK